MFWRNKPNYFEGILKKKLEISANKLFFQNIFTQELSSNVCYMILAVEYLNVFWFKRKNDGFSESRLKVELVTVDFDNVPGTSGASDKSSIYM